MTKDLAQGGVIVLRAVSSVITFWALAGLAVIFVGDAAIRGRVELALRAGGVIAFILWCAWVFLIRMSVRVDASALSARNLLRWVRIPWARVADVERRAQLRITLDDGSAVECWGSPFAPRAGARAGLREDGALQTVRAAWQSATGSDGPVTRGWDVPAVVVGVVLAGCAVVALLPW
jgi:hypothetical protein|nr:PH domain-containing protein [Microbacterium bovistercoris]